MSGRAIRLHDSPWQGVFYLAGGGTNLLGELLTTAGASRTVLDARIPYSQAAMTQLLGAPPEQACSQATARAMAMSAFQQARRLGASQPFGFACTASLATDREKKGEHRAHAAIQTAQTTSTANWTFSASRAEEEQALTALLWQKLVQSLDLGSSGDGQDAIAVKHTRGKPAWQALILGDELAHATAPNPGKLLLPGAFNPLHDGHRAMLTLSEQLTGLDGAYELSVANVDKPFLDYSEIETRLAQFDRPVWLTRLATFIEKARHFTGAHFIVGIDTLLRIVEPRYYGTAQVRDQALAEFREYDTHFIVFGRHLSDNVFTVLEDVVESLPGGIGERCIGVSEEVFSKRVSSTVLRKPTS